MAALLGLTLLLGACASLPQYQPAPASPTGYKLQTATSAAAPDHMHRYLNEAQTIVYFQNQGGGGLATGLLLGPIGVAANVSMIKAQTEKDAQALHDKLPVDVRAAFSDAAKHATLPLSDKGDAVLLSPSLLVTKLDDAHLRFAALLVADFGPTGAKISRRYVYELTQSFSKDQLTAGLSPADFAALSQGLQAGFGWDVSMLDMDVKGQFKPTAKGVLHSEFVTPRFQIPLAGYRFDAGIERLGFTTVGGVESVFYSLSADAAKITD